MNKVPQIWAQARKNDVESQGSLLFSLCDTVKQDKSEVGQIHFHFSDWLYTSCAKLSYLAFYNRPHFNGSIFCKDKALEGLQKQ